MPIDYNRSVNLVLQLHDADHFSINFITPVTNAVPVKMMPMPIIIIKVIFSPINKAPHKEPNRGIIKVTVMALVLPISASNLKYIRYAKLVHSTAKVTTASQANVEG